MLPFMALFGPGVIAARLGPILFSAITLILAFALARAWFGRGVAMVTVLLLAVNPSFIWFSRQGISVTSVMTVFSTGSLLLIEYWRQRDLRFEIRDFKGALQHPRSPISNLQSPNYNLQSQVSNLPLLFAGILVGLGLWAKFLFLWWIVILGVVALVWVVLHRTEETVPGAVRPGGHQRDITHNLKMVARPLPWLIAGFLIGAAPLLYFNLYDLLRQPFDLRNAYTLGLLFKSLGQTTDYGVNNLDLHANLGKAMADFNIFIDGSYFWYNGIPFSNVFAVPTFFLSVVAGSLLAIRRPEWRKWLALLLAIAVTVFLSAFTVSGLWATHLFIILPFPQMVVAVAAVWLAKGLGRLVRRLQDGQPQGAERTPANLQSLISILSVLIILALPFTRDLWVSVQHHAKLTETGGSGRFSDAIYTLAQHLDAAQIAAPVALDWGIEKNVRVLTNDRVQPEEVFGYTAEPDDAFRNRIRQQLQDPTRQYIVLWDRFAVYNRRKTFTEIANAMGLQVTETFIAHERSGLPVYVMLQAQ
jgi:hypothetical protein